VHEDVNNITTSSNHEVELVKFEHQEIGQVYIDPIDIYMEKFFITEPHYISSSFVVIRFIKLAVMKIKLEISITYH